MSDSSSNSGSDDDNDHVFRPSAAAREIASSNSLWESSDGEGSGDGPDSSDESLNGLPLAQKDPYESETESEADEDDEATTKADPSLAVVGASSDAQSPKAGGGVAQEPAAVDDNGDEDPGGGDNGHSQRQRPFEDPWDEPDDDDNDDQTFEEEANEAVEEVQEEEEEEEEEEDLGPLRRPRDRIDAISTIRKLERTYISTAELLAIRQGGYVQGPPVAYPMTRRDQWKRKFRWPVHVRNVKRKSFATNLDDISMEYEIEIPRINAADASPGAAIESAFHEALAPTARPLAVAAVTAIKESGGADSAQTVPPSQLQAIARVGGIFSDQLLEAMLTKNADALQGVDPSFSQQCWTPLPRSKKPIANWRFVLELLCRTSAHPSYAPADSAYPRIQKRTLLRIRDRLKALYGVTRQEMDNVFFDMVGRQEDVPDLEDEDIIAV